MGVTTVRAAPEQLQDSLKLIAAALKESLHCGEFHCCDGDTATVILATPQSKQDIKQDCDNPQRMVPTVTGRMVTVPAVPV